MNNLEYIDKQILLVKQNIQYHKDLLITVDDDESIEIIKSTIKLIEPDLQTLQQIKSELEAWYTVKPGIYQSIEITGKYHDKAIKIERRVYVEGTEKYNTLKKALEVE